MITKADSRGKKKEQGNNGKLKRVETLIRDSQLGQVKIILKRLFFPTSKIVIPIYVREVLSETKVL